jgi:hypothetical protein
MSVNKYTFDLKSEDGQIDIHDISDKNIDAMMLDLFNQNACTSSALKS